MACCTAPGPRALRIHSIARDLLRRIRPGDIRARVIPIRARIWSDAGSSIEAQYDRFQLPAPSALEDQLFLAGRLGLDKHEPQPGFALWAVSMQQRI
jgi:hypothetical protein